uniref:Uncharacterized protein n=1 Tax=Latimeria chalumnae TaxID=7897 RepID=H3B148_LATCH
LLPTGFIISKVTDQRNTTMAALVETEGSDLCCSICLDFFRDPVILDCSHSYCRACISQMGEREEENFCPQCRQHFSHRSLMPNPALASIVESFKKRDLKAEASQQSRKRERPGENKEFYCEEHDEKLKLFCEEDQQMICVVCGTSRSHKSHNLMPNKEAFEIYKEKLQKSVWGLQSQLKEAYECGEEGEKETKMFLEKTSHLKGQIRDGFSKLHEFLYKEEEKLKEKLQKKEMEILKQLEETGVKTAQEISKLEQLISEIQKRLNSQRAEELLKDINTILTGPLPAPPHTHTQTSLMINLKKNFFFFYNQYYRAERCLKDIADSVSIDPKTAYPHLVVSEDRTSVQWNNKQKKVPKNPERFMCAPAALGSEGFTSGRHYWEVEVGDSSIWSLGVARESVERRTPVETSSVNGFYLLYKTLGYAVLCPTRKRLHLPVKPRRIGVYLDYEGGQVSLYNAEDMSHIYTYTDIFTEKMYPYF